MALHFEKIRAVITSMGEIAAERQEISTIQTDELLKKLRKHATNWSHIDLCLKRAAETVDKQKYRAARPLYDNEPMHLGIDPPATSLPDRATLIAIDGSQALPSRHAPHLYYLINTGTIVYHHGSGTAPQEISQPKLYYLGDEETESAADFHSNRVSIQRDMAEIEHLARIVWENRYANAPILAILDQRLQYFPIGVNVSADASQFVGRWIAGMDTIKACNALLVGYIERPETGAVVTLLNTLDWGQEDFDPAILNERPAVADVVLFRRVLKAGQRSCVFEVVNQSTNYQPFQEAHQEICFFYYAPPGIGDITRVDVPKWAAQQPEVIAMIHSLLYDQCLLLGGYPYILSRADEVAVVQYSDREYLEHLIDLELRRHNINARSTVKQLGKDLSRSGKGRHSV